MVMLALWIIIEWYLLAVGRLDEDTTIVSDWLIWSIFLAETILLTALVDKKVAYLRNNWVNLVIIIAACPMIWWVFPAAGALRILRLMVMFSLVLHISARTRRMLSRNRLGSTLVTALILIIASGFIVAGLDPSIGGPWDGIWWAWVTMSTVGYGDIVPTTPEGRIFGGILILVGIGLFSLMTASFSAFFVSEDKVDQVRHELEVIQRLEELSQRLDKMERKINSLIRQSAEDDPDAL